MNKKQEEFLRELLADFMIEAAEHRQTIITGLLELEKDQDDANLQDLVEVTFREIHSLKGAARAVNLLEIERLCQGMESVFSLLKQQSIVITHNFFDTLYSAIDLLDQYLTDLSSHQKTVNAEKLVNILNGVQALCKGADSRMKKASDSDLYVPIKTYIDPPTSYQPIVPNDVANTDKPVNPVAPLEPSQVASLTSEHKSQIIDVIGSKETVRISISKLSELLIQAEELITSKSMIGYDLHELNRIGQHNSNINKGLNGHDTQIQTLNDDIQVLTKNLDQHYRFFSRTIDDLLFSLKNTLLVPFSSGLDWLPKFVRDLSKDLKKEVRFSIVGGEMEIDRRILEKIKDPLIHLVRNSIDHGIEMPEQRLKYHKSSSGNLSIIIAQQNNREVTLTISDDGAGINREKVIQASLKAGIVSDKNVLNMKDNEVVNLVFHSGISTSPFITDLSGHGLGLAIVAESVTSLGGSISVDSVKSKGTTFIITLPITLLTFRGILIRIGEHHFVIPTKSVERVLRIKSTDIRNIENKEMINVNGLMIGVTWLSKVLELSSKTPRSNKNEIFHALIINAGQHRMVFVVDDILDEQEGIIKTFGSQLINVRNVSGATLLGNGRIVPILNASELIETSLNIPSFPVENVDFNADESNEFKQTILVADDSITSRSLIRNIVESAGYQVKTAVDGSQAYSLLNEEHFDLVVSDIEMPKMNGFELTLKIRNDKNFSELPVILVTALEQPSDKQRGMACGANAYIVKSSFEQSNLIDAIKRLI
jgi:two-component system, chemotaxis family, sensor kinase CheA